MNQDSRGMTIKIGDYVIQLASGMTLGSSMQSPWQITKILNGVVYGQRSNGKEERVGSVDQVQKVVPPTPKNIDRLQNLPQFQNNKEALRQLSETSIRKLKDKKVRAIFRNEDGWFYNFQWNNGVIADHIGETSGRIINNIRI